MHSLGEIIAKYRKKNKLSQKELSNMLGNIGHSTSNTSVSNWEKNFSELFFASTFWTKLQNIFGHCCKTFLDIVACPNWTKLQCPGWLRNKPAVKPLQTLFNCYSTRYGNGSSEFSSSCACSLKY